ncbi:MAG: galactose mutarotase [Notoacmeibacter sp.]|nr:galactose mutarotase [Notoacmeibacter sp.]MCC0031653.1 galactose mutarotase [Brucellaceae bacterium]
MSAPERFGTGPEGEAVHRVTLENGGTVARIMTWGAGLTDLRISGVDHALVLGSPEFPPYLTVMRFFGVIAGRVANRIAKASAPLNGRKLQLERNENGRTALHGGTSGSGTANWVLDGHGDRSCRMCIRLADGQGGFPGNLDLVATYGLEADGALTLTIEGRTDAPTFCSPAHHAYWNLDGKPDLSGHRLRVNAQTYLPVDGEKIPLGAPRPVAGTRFDFHEARNIIEPGDEPLDHNFCLDGTVPLHPACRLEAGGIVLDVATTAPGLQLYDGAHINTAPWLGHHGRPHRRHAGLAIEPQAWPDAPNHPDFPSILLMPGQTFRQVSRFHAHPAMPERTVP